MSHDDHNDRERQDVLAELAELGEEPLDEDELAAARALAGDLDGLTAGADGDGGDLSALHLLMAGGAHATLAADRSASLLEALGGRLNAPHRQTADELRAIDEAVDEAGLGREVAAASVVGGVADAFSGRAELPEPGAADVPGVDDALEGLHILRASSPAAELSPERSAHLYAQVAERARPETGDPKVVPLRPGARRWPAWLAAAAALLIVFAAALAIVLDQPAPEPTASMGPVAQVELQQAERHLAEVEADSLSTLMSATQAPDGQRGDHYLRRLREARSNAMMARAQARERRL